MINGLDKGKELIRGVRVNGNLTLNGYESAVIRLGS